MAPGEKVQVEPSNAHDWVIGVALIASCDIRRLVPDKGEFVVTGVDRLEEGWGSREEWDILDIWIMFLELACQYFRSL